MVEDDEGHASLIESNIRRAGVNNPILPFLNGTAALEYLFGEDGSGTCMPEAASDSPRPQFAGYDRHGHSRQDQINEHLKRAPVVVLTTTDDSREIQRCYDLGANVYITKPVDYDGFANAIRQLGLFFAVMQVPESD